MDRHTPAGVSSRSLSSSPLPSSPLSSSPLSSTGAASSAVESTATLRGGAPPPTPATADTAPSQAVNDAAEPSADDGILGALSPSRASDFMTCPLLYRFRVIDRLPERPGLAATRGTVIHAVLEELFDLPASDRTPERAGVLVRPAWERLLAAEPDLAALFADDADGSALSGWLASAAELVGRYFTLEDPRRLEPRERELYVETVLDSGLVLRGYVDRLDVANGGAMRVVDYKTGRAPGAGYEAKALFQMRFYALVLWRLRGVVPRLLQLVYLGSGEVLRYEPDEADLRATERKVRALWEAITRAVETGDWRPSPSKLCEWCDHKVRCPAFGGTPPPLPTLLPLQTGPGAVADDLTAVDAPTPRQTHFDDV
jgi:putative RecB family exonuclease